MDRLSRSVIDMLTTVKDLTGRGVVVRFDKEGLTFRDTSNPCNDLMLTIMAAIPEFERALALERHGGSGSRACPRPRRSQRPLSVAVFFA